MDDNYLTDIPGAPRKSDAIPGMAYFAGTGPASETCGTCEFRGYYRKRAPKWDAKLQQMVERTYLYGGCAMYRKLVGHDGAKVAKANSACKYFKPSLHKAK